ncbi:MAG TPA: ABC transporter ATP-binding protein [Solirubrobacteraceae bacterium]|jgi:ABC-type sulfate/molybdate transport systems ATPase subunit|nr:ABC transporter ATP-binding protein [Solirubrobacteraceae bacterium]
MDALAIDILLPRRAFDLRAALSVGCETIVLVGLSGAGKTSLLRAVAGLEQPRSGRISLGSEPWFDAEGGIRLPAERRRVGYLPQDYGLFPHLTVAGNVRFAGRRERPDLLERFGISHLARARPRQLSGGERQRAGLARALARDPRVLLLDEPFAALDAITRRQVREELADLLAELALPTLLVTHAFEDAAVLAHRVGVLDQGRLLQLATSDELMSDPADATVAALTGANVLEATAVPGPSGSIVRIKGGGELASSTPAHGPVQVAVHPWEFELADPGASALTDTVISVRAHGSGIVLRLTRLTVQVPSSHVGWRALVEGATVGVTAAPDAVRVLPACAHGAR